ncbi:hypothetical protein K435DRAFT_838668 [Dendrothele bispora CBS 962.96]|uniref:Uncharacterized protein n=1 Tax=Dendrothele bispora (strain CBS 962.96) TaxID=1314807 RepID=A0A4S8M6H8_DENBC|nr:hypothetical protein K435DRAFT_838668 [Dendrothele bispora CBS 962.96]
MSNQKVEKESGTIVSLQGENALHQGNKKVMQDLLIAEASFGFSEKWLEHAFQIASGAKNQDILKLLKNLQEAILSKEELAQAGAARTQTRGSLDQMRCNKARRGSVNSVKVENSMKKAQSSGSKVVDQQEGPCANPKVKYDKSGDVEKTNESDRMNIKRNGWGEKVTARICHRTTYDVAEVDQASTLAQGVATKGGSDVGSIGESRVEEESCEKK